MLFKKLIFMQFILLLFGVLMTFNSGCTMAGGAWVKPQSHFDFPNSNIIPLGKVTGKASSTTCLMPGFMDVDLEERAVNEALKQKGGDVLIDYTYSFKSTVPLIPIVFFNDAEVDGTACKMEIGKQELK